MKQVGRDKDKENVVQKCHYQQDACHANGIQLDESQKDDAHAGTHNILPDPKKSEFFGMGGKKGHVQPTHSKGIAQDAGYNVDIGNVTKICRTRLPHYDFSVMILAGQFATKWMENHLHDGTTTTEGIHNFDDRVNLSSLRTVNEKKLSKSPP
jgi:hypothetical protein